MSLEIKINRNKKKPLFCNSNIKSGECKQFSIECCFLLSYGLSHLPQKKCSCPTIK